jgi:hypothetical protein
MGATFYRERHALQLHKYMDGMPILDPSNHLKRLEVGASNKEIGLHYLEQIKERCAAAFSGAAARKSPELANIRCWHDTPELYRRMVARAAGLGVEVVAKFDRDLTEREKELLRSAVRDLWGHLNSLVNL